MKKLAVTPSTVFGSTYTCKAAFYKSELYKGGVKILIDRHVLDLMRHSSQLQELNYKIRSCGINKKYVPHITENRI